MKNKYKVLHVYIHFLTVLLISLSFSTSIYAYSYSYDIEGKYTDEFGFTLGTISGSSIVSDTYPETTSPDPIYDQWDVLSFEFTAGSYHFVGINGVIERYETSNGLSFENTGSLFWGESENIYIGNTGPGFMPPELMSFGAGILLDIPMDDGTTLFLGKLSFNNGTMINVPEPGTLTLLAMGLGIITIVARRQNRK